MGYRIKREGERIDVEIRDMPGDMGALLEAFRRCGRGCADCTGPGGNGDIESVDVEPHGNGVMVHLRCKPGSFLDPISIEECLAMTMAATKRVKA